MKRDRKRKTKAPKGVGRPAPQQPLTRVRQRRTLSGEVMGGPLFVERTPPFLKSVRGVLEEEEIQDLMDGLRGNPEQGDRIPRSKGLWKLRWPAQGRGKRGGARIIYYLRNGGGLIQLLYAYLKSQKEDLTPKELKELRRWV